MVNYSLPGMIRTKTYLLVLLVFSFAIQGRSQDTSVSLPNVVIPLYLQNGIRGNMNLAPATSGSPFTIVPGNDSTVTTFSNDQYSITVMEAPNPAHTSLHVEAQSLTGEPFQLNEISLELSVPSDNIDGVWTPAVPAVTEASLIAAPAGTPLGSGAHPNFGLPYIAAASASGQSVLAVGRLRQDEAVFMYAYPNGEGAYTFRVWLPEAHTGQKITEDFYISNIPSQSWFDAAQDYADWVDGLNGYQPFPLSPNTREPLYDTWYWSLDQVDAQLYAQAAQAASDVGMGMFLADSGWDNPPGEFAKGLYGETGNYTPPSDEFPDINSVFDTMRTQYNLGHLLWVQPFAVGRASKRFPQTAALHIVAPADPIYGIDASESVNVDPRVQATQDYLKALFTELATKYTPDGFWIDFIETISNYCIADHAHDYAFGDGLRASLQTIRDTILQNVPNAVVYNRGPYANLNNKAFASVWQPTDSPGDFDLMRIRALQMRPFSRGVAFASDEMYWPDSADPQTVAKFVMTSLMVGTPALGGDIVHASEATKGVVTAWIGFYRQHQADLNNGNFVPFGNFRVPNHRIETSDRSFVYLRNLDAAPFPVQGTKEIYVLNATDSNDLQFNLMAPVPGSYSVTIFDAYLNKVADTDPVQAGPDGSLNVTATVEQGGALLLTPQTTSQ